MFEKEAEDNKPPYAFCTLDTECELWKDGFQKGAEFGYNKANEWHILAEEPDVLPKEEQKVKVLTEDNVIQESTYFYDDYFEEMAFSNVGLVKVLAWKEIKEK